MLHKHLHFFTPQSERLSMEALAFRARGATLGRRSHPRCYFRCSQRTRSCPVAYRLCGPFVAVEEATGVDVWPEAPVSSGLADGPALPWWLYDKLNCSRPSARITRVQELSHAALLASGPFPGEIQVLLSWHCPLLSDPPTTAAVGGLHQPHIHCMNLQATNK